jgi:hypothetical protein
VVVLLTLANGEIAGFPKIAPDQLLPVFVQVMTFGVPFGAVVAAFTGWYKRFLTLSSGNGNRRKAK